MAGDHKCPVCQATFTRPQHVARHMRSHTGDRPYKCQHCGDQFARSDLLSRHINKCHASERPPTTTAPNQRRKGNSAASRATTSKQACDQCVQSSLPCDGANPCSKCIQRKYRCTYVKFHRQTAPSGPGHLPPPRADAEVGIGASLYAPGVSSTAAARYAQAPPHDDFAYSHGSLATQASSGLYPSQYSFNPSLNSYAPPPGSATDPTHHGEPLDFAQRYRQQAELLRRAGVIPPPSVQDTNQLQPGIGVPPYSGTYPSWTDDGARKDIEHFDQYSYLDPSRQPYLRQPQHPQQLPPMQPYAPEMQNNGYYGHGRSASESWNSHHSRRASFAESDGSSVGGNSSLSSSATSSTGNNLPLDLASHPRGGYAPPSLPPAPMADNARPSTAPGPSNTSGHTRAVSDGGHDGFSSAFGLMSIDDPAVLAGMAPDAQPFFSGMGLTTPTPAKEREARDRYTSLFAMTGNPAPGRDSRDIVKDEPTLAGLTPREAETRELREFWKAYMRTPLTGGGPLGGPTPTNSGSMLGAPNDTEAPRPSLAGKRGLSRVASLPSVKTPAREQAQYAPGNMMPPVQRSTYNSSNADDLRSYEQAVLSRRAPMNLNLIPKRARAGSSAVLSGYDDGHASSTSPPSQNTLQMPPRPNTASAYHSTTYTYDPTTRGTSTTTSTDDGSGNSSDPERGGGRPNFKRLASQTLGPEHAKAPRYATYNGAGGSVLDGDDGVVDDAELQRMPRVMANAAERQRRLSAPSADMPPPSLEASYA